MGSNTVIYCPPLVNAPPSQFSLTPARQLVLDLHSSTEMKNRVCLCAWLYAKIFGLTNCFIFHKLHIALMSSRFF